MSKSRVRPPTWRVTFDHISAKTCAAEIGGNKVQKYVTEVAKLLCSDEWKPRECALTSTDNLLVFGVKWEDGVDIYVTQDYWEDNITPRDYGMVK